MKILDNLATKITKDKKEVFTKNEILNMIKKVSINTDLPNLFSNGVSININEKSITFNRKKTIPPKKVFDLLYYLIKNKNKVCGREKIMQDVWGEDVMVTERTVDVHIRKIREIVGSEFLLTRVSSGYVWIEK